MVDHRGSGSSTSPIIRPLIAVSTYQRPAGLRRLLESLEHEVEPWGSPVLVIDNDPAGSAEAVARAFETTIYSLEPTPGIVATRNRALSTATSEYDALVFVDDDEWVTPGWLCALVDYANSTNADIVQGAVRPEDAPAPGWIERGGFLERTYPPAGSLLPFAATNNTLLRLSTWRELGRPRFDPSFSRTGGSDTDFFARLVAAGATARYCATAIVIEALQPDRLTAAWIARRYLRNGIVLGRLSRRSRPAALVLLRGLARSCYGLALLVTDAIFRRRITSRSSIRLLEGLGQALSVFGVRIEVYR